MHNVEYFTYPEKINMTKVEKELDAYVARVDWEEGACGLPFPLRFLDKVFEDYDAAQEFVEEDSRHRPYNSVAVKYKEYPPIRKKSAAEVVLEARVKEQMERLRTAIEEADPRKRKSEYIGCPRCRSTLRRELLKDHICPLCGRTLRSETAQKRIINADKRLHELQDALKAEKKAQDKKTKPTIKWLVRIEYHT